MTYGGWTEERVKRLRTLWSSGESASQCAAKLGGITRNAVISKVHRIGLAGRATKNRSRFVPRQPIQRSKPKAVKPAPQKKSSTVQDLLKSLPTEPLPPIDTMPAAVSMNDLASHHCRAITVDYLPFDASAKIYCGQRKVLGTPYCEDHCRRYFAPPTTARTNPGGKPVYLQGAIGAVMKSDIGKLMAAEEFTS